MTNADPEFYRLIGPYLSRREIVAELGFPVWDEPGKEWWLALDGDQVCGFAAIRFEPRAAIFCSDYVRPERRGQRIYDQLMRARLNAVHGRAKRAEAIVTDAARRAYERHGFQAAPTGKRPMKNYTRMVREFSDAQS